MGAGAESAADDGGAHQAERRRAEAEQAGVEPLQRESGAPLLASLVPQLHDLQLAPGVPAVGRVERGAAGLGQRGGARPMAVPPRTGGAPPPRASPPLGP